MGGEGGGRATLSSEQVCRMEENRKRAQEKLAKRRRVGGPQTAGLDSHSNSQPTSGGLNFKTPRSVDMPDSASMNHEHCAKKPFPAKSDPTASNAPSIHPRPTSDSSHQRLSNGLCVSRPATSVPPTTSHTQGNYHGNRVAHPPTSLHGCQATSTSAAAAAAAVGAHPGGTSVAAGSCSGTDGPSWPKFSALQKKISANLTLVSRSRFKAVAPYDASLIEVFKKMPSRSYGRALESFQPLPHSYMHYVKW